MRYAFDGKTCALYTLSGLGVREKSVSVAIRTV
jgi:hypothetical protein